MTTTGKRLRTYWAERHVDWERAGAFALRYWQVALIVAVIGLAAGLRLWDLGERAIHHDESIHMKFGYDIVQSGPDVYRHDPTYHGPFQFFGIALTFILFGDSDYTGRLFPAFFGIALVGLPFLLRRQLGTLGAFVAAALLALSPILLYNSRFTHTDMYPAFFTLAMVVCIWRFIAARAQVGPDGRHEASSSAPGATPAMASLASYWRYLAEHGYLWLVAIAPLMMFSYAAKEMTYMIVALLLVYLDILVATELVQQLRASRAMSLQETILAYAVLLPGAWLIVALWPLIEGIRKRFSLSEMPAAGHALVLIGTLAAPNYAAGIQKLPGIGDAGYMGEPNLMRATVLVLMFGAAYIGLLWNWRVWLLAAVLFYVPYLVLFTSFFSNMGGFWTGIWGSMDYWMGQQHVRRGNQPDYYYFMLLPVYEFLPLVFALGGSLYYAFRTRLEHRLLAGSALLLVLILMLLPDSAALIGGIRIHLAFLIVIGAALLLPMEGFTKFLLFWTLASLFAFTVAGEKMPWLTVHIALPLALLAAKVLDDILSSVGVRREAVPAEPAPAPARGRRKAREEPAAEAARLSWGQLAPLGYGAGLALIAALVFQAYGPGSAFSLVGWFFALSAAAVVSWVGSRVSLRAAGQVAAVALFAALLVFTVRAGATAAFDQGDPDGTPPELLIYAQGSPKLGILRDNIDQLAKETGLGYDLRIVLDNTTNIWPWPWYLRKYRNVQYTGFDETFVPEPGSVVLVSVGNQSKLEPYLENYREGIPYTHMWWFPELYRGLQTDDFLGDLFQGKLNRTWRAYFIDRTVPGGAPGADMLAYFPKEFTPIVPEVPAGPAAAEVLPEEQQTVIGGPGTERGRFAQPADLAVDAEGNLYVVDTLNHRFQKLAPDGEATALGEVGNGSGQFANPAESGEFAPDGPWGIAVDDEGNIYVADTWNHRVQKFGPDFTFIMEWGAGEFFGPRDIAIDADGNLLIADTGNKRVLKYTTDGELIEVFGQAGRDPGDFNEPTSISVNASGDIYVADYWNRRIQHFNRDFEYVDEIKVETWGSQGITDRAYIVALNDGTVLATDPANGRILVYDPSGQELAAWRLAPQGVLSRPVGITVDGFGRVYISDGFASEVRTVLLPTLLQPPPAAP